jgi:hypothetical protein
MHALLDVRDGEDEFGIPFLLSHAGICKCERVRERIK